ncbi:autophagocytosis associated protein [Jimgerdemannia flammicorona]|uniref:Ubiquitin-like-conjugating enzyme ATG10 n=1 Tax=Jimgerdemannia flammicorona TaxID=994334 RepID=A0A433QMK1_9FUNG|nr:autophagocytosis associated protein [Jimgerdemannia flammicorona]
MPPAQTPLQHYPYLTRQEFDLAARGFLEQASTGAPEDGWAWVVPTQVALDFTRGGVERSRVYGYLASKRTLAMLGGHPTSGEVTDVSLTQAADFDDDDDFGVIEEEDASSVVPQTHPLDKFAVQNPAILIVDYHIVYSSSYQVPVLYFNAFYSDGTPLPLCDLYAHLVPTTYHSHLIAATSISHQGSISQQDHPVLGIPYFYVHPCETSTLMTAVKAFKGDQQERLVGAEGYLRAWLSLVGGPVGCKVNVGYFLEKEVSSSAPAV